MDPLRRFLEEVGRVALSFETLAVRLALVALTVWALWRFVASAIMVE